jgi:NAD(P)H-flavin reductase
MNGRSIFAIKDIKKGDKVFSDGPIVMAPYVADEKKKNVKGCNHCAASLMSICLHGKVFKYLYGL